MPYPESCPECGGVFRNTGTHFTARRNEIGRHVLLELGCQNTTRRFWWDFTSASVTQDGRTIPARRTPAPTEHAVAVVVRNGASNGHAAVSTLERPDTLEADAVATPAANTEPRPQAFDLAAVLSASLGVNAIPPSANGASSTSIATNENPLRTPMEPNGTAATSPVFGTSIGDSSTSAPVSAVHTDRTA